MEKQTKHGEWEGHRLFCECDGVEWSVEDYLEGKVTCTDREADAECPDCVMYLWYYLNPADEPKLEG